MVRSNRQRPSVSVETSEPGIQNSGANRCAWGGCAKNGGYRAPKDRTLGDYQMFCLEHVRIYNARWNFHAGLSPEEMEQEIRRATTWDRPTWKLGELGANIGGGTSANIHAHIRSGRVHVDDPFGFTEGTAFDPARKAENEERSRASNPKAPPANARNKTIQTLGLTAPITLDSLRRRYKALVKRHHPDANGGSAEAETRMKVINDAYHTLRAGLAP
ncbi:MAG: J domain-containing protein [Rhodospirillaceae bacterium]|nr:J domain-containing protein [Rhodospirillaceae bacterium]